MNACFVLVTRDNKKFTSEHTNCDLCKFQIPLLSISRYVLNILKLITRPSKNLSSLVVGYNVN